MSTEPITRARWLSAVLCQRTGRLWFGHDVSVELARLDLPTMTELRQFFAVINQAREPGEPLLSGIGCAECRSAMAAPLGDDDAPELVDHCPPCGHVADGHRSVAVTVYDGSVYLDMTPPEW